MSRSCARSAAPLRCHGFALYEAVLALILLSVGLLTAAGLVRAVGQQSEGARIAGETALVAQQTLERSLADGIGAYPEHTDTVAVGSSTYAVRRTSAALANGLERIRIVVSAAGDPGFGPRPWPEQPYSTSRRPELPGPAPP